ncbi:hypothetical protein LTS02_005634 [Friedmanniomyces endolithicus]|nr:hypothetical protein LTS02_005634 [Friedmanniomyces endolithicus]
MYKHEAELEYDIEEALREAGFAFGKQGVISSRRELRGPGTGGWQGRQAEETLTEVSRKVGERMPPSDVSSAACVPDLWKEEEV